MRTGRPPRTDVCNNGHVRTEKNTYIRPNGTRECRICKAAGHARLRERRKAKQASEAGPGRPPLADVCQNGHPRTKANTYYRRSNGTRVCRICMSQSSRRWRQLKKEASQTPQALEVSQIMEQGK